MSIDFNLPLIHTALIITLPKGANMPKGRVAINDIKECRL